jgi:hypothetical protein
MSLITQDWAEQFFEGHLNLLGQGKIDEAVDLEFAPDATILSFVDFKNTLPPHTVEGQDAVKAFLHDYIHHLGSINIIKITKLVAFDDVIAVQDIFSCNLGVMLAGDIFEFDARKRVRRLIATCFRVNP